MTLLGGPKVKSPYPVCVSATWQGLRRGGRYWDRTSDLCRVKAEAQRPPLEEAARVLATTWRYLAEKDARGHWDSSGDPRGSARHIGFRLLSRYRVSLLVERNFATAWNQLGSSSSMSAAFPSATHWWSSALYCLESGAD